MKSALRRQLELTGWQALGFALGCLLFIVVAYIWGQGIEGQVTQIARQQHRDHRHIIAIERGHPLGGGDASQPPSHGGQQPGPPGGGHQGNGGSTNPPVPSPPEHPASESASTPKGPVPATVEHVEEVVRQTPAGPVLETVNGTACHLVASC